MLGRHIFPPTAADGSPPRKCPSCEAGELSLKLGRFGAFVGCSNYPECRYTRQLGQTAEQAGAGQPTELGSDPETGEPVTLRNGRFGPYVQRGDGKEAKRSGIPKGTDPSSVDFEAALKLLALPREVGKHPETGEPITAQFRRRFGPYVAHQKTYASLEIAGRRLHRRPQSCRHADRREEGEGEKLPRPRAAEGTGQEPRRRRHQADEGPLRALRQRRRDQRGRCRRIPSRCR